MPHPADNDESDHPPDAPTRRPANVGRLRSDEDRQYQRRLGTRIKLVRIIRNLSQDQLATAAGLTRNFVGGVESGRHGVDIARLVRLAAALNIDIGLLARDPTDQPHPGLLEFLGLADRPESDDGSGRADNPPGRAQQPLTSPKPDPPTTPTPHHHTPNTAGDEPPPATHPRSPAQPDQPDR